MPRRWSIKPIYKRYEAKSVEIVGYFLKVSLDDSLSLLVNMA